jgi:hypothetical protein
MDSHKTGVRLGAGASTHGDSGDERIAEYGRLIGVPATEGAHTQIIQSCARYWPAAIHPRTRWNGYVLPARCTVWALSAVQVPRARWAATMFPFPV